MRKPLFYCITVSVIALCLFIFYLSGNPRVLPLDDAYIHFVYAKNLAEGYGLCFNSGETSFGTSSPLWVVLLALWAKTGMELYTGALFLSFFFHIISALLIFIITNHIVKEKDDSSENTYVFPFLASLFYVAIGNMTWLAMSGMETELFHTLCLLSIYLYLKTGYGRTTAMAAGALLLCRITGTFLVLPLIVIDVYKKKRIPLNMVLTFLIIAPYYIYHRAVTGLFFPVTGKGKLLTYVDGSLNPVGILSFFTAVIKYLLFYEPAVFVLMVVSVIGFCKAWKNKDGSIKNTGIILISFWVLLHCAVHTLIFKTLNQHIRYLSVIFPALSVLGPLFLRDVVKSRKLSYILIGLLLFITFFQQLFWRDVYRKNCDHISRVYISCTDWITETTADPSIAAFDIGIIKYFTGRYVIDLGGVTDSTVHTYLKKHNAGEMLREKGVSLIVYSRFPDCDVWSGIFYSAYDPSFMLKETRQASFSTGYYEAPSITHSFQLDVGRIDEWVTPEGSALEDYFYTEWNSDKPIHPEKLKNGLTLIDLQLDQKRRQVVRNMVQSVSLTYYWTANKTIKGKPVVRTMIVNRRSGKVIADNTHIPTHDLFGPEFWEPGKVIREKHIVWIPDNSPPGTYDVWVGSGDKDLLNKKKERGMTIKDAFVKIAGLPLDNFPVHKGPLNGIRAVEFSLEESSLHLLY